MKIHLPYPHKALWPNGRAHWAAKARETKKHHSWAHTATLAVDDRPKVSDDKLTVHITVHGKPTGPLPDEDNVAAAFKAYQDGIASAIGIDDRHFAAPTVSFADTRTGKFVVEIGG